MGHTARRAKRGGRKEISAVMSHRCRWLGTLSTLALAGALAGCGGDDVESDELGATAGPPLKFESYEVLFTNPTCKLYEYAEPVMSVSGEELTAKPKDAYCTKEDRAASAARPTSPQYRLLEWINDPDTREIFFTYLSFSNSTVRKELCKAIQERNVKVTFVMDSTQDDSNAKEILNCHPGNGDANAEPRMEKRGHENGLLYAHNKLFVVNPNADTVKLAFSSGNMSSGTVLHHENWHFITVPSDTYFAQVHLCLIEAELEHGHGKKEFSDFMAQCRSAIPHKEEGDIKAFFAPSSVETKRAYDYLLGAIRKAQSIDIGAHRFSNGRMLGELKKRMSSSGKPKMRIVVDDDIYWAGQDNQTGDNLPFEFYNVDGLRKNGAGVRYMETNHGEHLLHHNKFLIFDMPGSTPDAVFGGAGNLTTQAFEKNWENFYYISIPKVVEAFRAQYKHLFDELGTAPEDMPVEDVAPTAGH
jgi:hypothetical protein